MSRNNGARRTVLRGAAVCVAVVIGCSSGGIGGSIASAAPAFTLDTTYAGLPVDRAKGVLPVARLDSEHVDAVHKLYDQLYTNIYVEDAYNKLPVADKPAYDAMVIRATDARAFVALQRSISEIMLYGDIMDSVRMVGRQETALGLLMRDVSGKHAKVWRDFSANMPVGSNNRELCDTQRLDNAAYANIGAGNRAYYSYSPTPHQVRFARADQIVLQSDAGPTPTQNNRYCARQPQREIMAGPDIDAGHIFADSLGGKGVIENMAPQSASFNRRGAQYQFEEQVRRDARANDVIGFRYAAPFPDDGSMKLTHYQYCTVPKGKGAQLARNTGGFFVSDEFIERVYQAGGSCTVASLYDRDGSVFMSKSGRTLAQGRVSDTYTHMYDKGVVPAGARSKGVLISPTGPITGLSTDASTGKDGDDHGRAPGDKSSTTTTTGRTEPATTGRTTATTSTATTSSNITTGAAEPTSQSTARRSTSTHVVDSTITSTGRGSSSVADTTIATTRTTTTNATTSTRQEPMVTTSSTTASTTTTTTTRTPWYDKYAPSTTTSPTRSSTFSYQRDQWSSLEREVDRARANKRASDHGGVTVIPTLPREMERVTEHDTVPSNERAQGATKNTAQSTVQSTGSNSTATNTASSVTPSTTQQPQNQGELAVTGSSTRTLLYVLGVAVSAVFAPLIAFGLRSRRE